MAGGVEALERLMEMARRNRKPDPGPEAGVAGTGKVVGEPSHLSDDDFANRKQFTFGLAETVRGGPAARKGTKEEELRDFGSR